MFFWSLGGWWDWRDDCVGGYGQGVSLSWGYASVFTVLLISEPCECLYSSALKSSLLGFGGNMHVYM